MDYENKTIRVVKRFNNSEGTVVELCKDEGIGRTAFYSRIEKLGIKKEGEKYAFPNEQIEGQLNITSNQEEPEEREQVKEMEQIASIEDKTSIREKEVKRVITTRRKKTFEISEGVEAAIKMMAILEGKTINDYVNDTLEKSIDDKVKRMVLETYQF